MSGATLLHSNTENICDKNPTQIKCVLLASGSIPEGCFWNILINSFWEEKVPFFVVFLRFAMFRKVIQTLKKDSLQGIQVSID